MAVSEENTPSEQYVLKVGSAMLPVDIRRSKIHLLRSKRKIWQQLRWEVRAEIIYSCRWLEKVLAWIMQKASARCRCILP